VQKSKNMKKLLLLVVGAIVSGTLFAQPAETYIGEKVKVTFPGKPDSTSNQLGAKILTYNKDTSKIYSTLMLDVAPMGLSADMVASMGDGLWDQIKSPMMAQMGNVDILKDEVVPFKGKSCLKIELDLSKAAAENMKGKKMYMLCFFIGSVLHQLNVTTLNATDMKPDAEAFFNTLIIE
jgi:hypothetical protein